MTDLLAAEVPRVRPVEQLSVARIFNRRGIGRNRLQRLLSGGRHRRGRGRGARTSWMIEGIMRDMSAGVDEVGR
ncbi:hypothetical protein AB0I89_12680 [Micromonospora sp. NPDC049801]|uniref:hypothetical protein n=1 Tax=unclassified Micromonospora TaxID=2617518 RepID=UPI0033DC3872